MALQIKRGTNLQRLELLLAAGEPFFVTDAEALGVSPLWVGDGTTFGGVASMSPAVLTELTDVTIAGPADKQVLQYQGSTGQWANSNDLQISGQTILSGSLWSIGGAETESLDTNYNGVSYPLANSHTVTKPFTYTGIVTSGGARIVSSTNSLPTVAAGTRIVFPSIGSIGSVSGIAANNIYYVFNSTAGAMYLASTRANALAGTGLSAASGSASGLSETGQIYAEPGFGVGIAHRVSLDGGLTDKTAMQSAVVATDVSVGAEDFDYKLFLMTDGAIPSTPQFQLTSAGVLTATTVSGTTVSATTATVTGSTGSTSKDTGALVIQNGGLGVEENVNIGGTLSTGGAISSAGAVTVSATTESTGSTTGALKVAGGVGVAGKLNVAGDVRLSSATDSSSISTGALIVDGGVGVGGNMFVDGYFRVLNQAVIDNDLTVSGNLIVNGTTTTINSTTLSVDDKNIELGSVASSTDTTANGGGITLKNAQSGDKTIAWYSASNSWEFSNDIKAPGAYFGNILVAASSNNNTITSQTGNLTLTSATGNVDVNPGSLTVGVMSLGAVGSGTISTTANYPLVLAAYGSHSVQVSANNLFKTIGNSQLGESNATTLDILSKVTSDITFGDSGTTMRGVRGTAGSNDYWFVGADASATDSGSLILATGDNGTESIVVRQYTGSINDANTSYRELTLLDASGNTTLPGTLNVGGFGVGNGTLGSSTLVTTATTANQVLDTVDMTAYRTVKYVIQAYSTGNGVHSMECLVMHDNTTAYIQTYGEMYSGSSLISTSVDVSGSNMRLLVTPTNASTTIKVTKTSIAA